VTPAPSSTGRTGSKSATAATRHGCNGASPNRAALTIAIRRSTTWDNAVAESVLGLFKSQAVAPRSTFRTDPVRSLADVEARTNYVDWLDMQRLHSVLNNSTPEEFWIGLLRSTDQLASGAQQEVGTKSGTVHSGIGGTIDVDAIGLSTDTAGMATTPPGSGGVGVIGKHCNPFLVWLVWPPITLGIYHVVWWYKINREVRDFDQRIEVSPGAAVLALFPGAVILVPPYVSVWNTGDRIRRVQAAGDHHWINATRGSDWSWPSGEQIEQLLGVLLLPEYLNAERIRPAQGDRGIDVRVPGGDGWTVYQNKWFVGELTP
jgi:hypothetical protein